MKQTLFYLPAQIWGIPLFGLGILFWCVLLFAVVSLVLRVRKHGWDEEARGYIPLYLIVEALIVFVVPHVSQEQGFPIRGYGVFLLLGIVAGGGLLLYRAKKLWNVPAEVLISLALWGIISGLIGARLFYITEYWSSVKKPDFFSTLISIVSITEGGLVVYGSIIGGTLGILFFLYRNKLPILATFDLIAPGLLLGLALGRIGCLMNGCCFGGVCDHSWAVEFPPASPAHFYQLEHDQVFWTGLKFHEEPPKKPEELWKPVELNPEMWEESLSIYARDKRSRLRIEEVQPGSPAENAGIKVGMSVLAFGTQREGKKPKLFLVKEKFGFLCFVDEFLKNWKTDQENHREMLIATDSSEPFYLYTLPVEPIEVRKVHPTQIYSSLCAAAGCVLLLVWSRRCKKDGEVFLVFLFFYSIVRFLLETIRTDEGSFLGTGFTVSQNVSILVFCGAILLGIYISRCTDRRGYEGRFPVPSEKSKPVPKTK